MEHRLECSHEFNRDNIRILDEEKILNKRLLSETIFIKQQTNGLNLQNNTELLNKAYDSIIIFKLSMFSIIYMVALCLLLLFQMRLNVRRMINLITVR